MNIIKNNTFTGTATIGLIRGYSKISITNAEFKAALLKAQQEIYKQYGIGLSVKLLHSEILFLGQEEPSIDLQIIQYPKFPQTEENLKIAFVALLKLLMIDLEQNRVVVLFTDETLMLEVSDSIDPRIQL
ncbi:hypothetical protein [Flavobacterium aciduliphilum]|uniref:Uncharacterized protein n=1 Tax=Flavobacterium aciduliphilum TaxID=1101402 RepID=A0A328YNG5_9FLAO|nr:hypothetical protein [Flavobacterium aciduliphilum]RAR73692.1 hypothetical protein CLV55_10311 [Flavobacterium aciduliphilum]